MMMEIKMIKNRGVEKDKGYNSGLERGFYVKMSIKKYLINLLTNAVFASIFIGYLLSINKFASNTVQYSIVFLFIFFIGFRLMEYLLTGKTISRLFYVEQGNVASIYFIVYLVLLGVIIFTLVH